MPKQSKTNLILSFKIMLVLSLFLFLFSDLASATIAVTQIQNTPLSATDGSAHLSFNSGGTELFAVDNWRGSNPNHFTIYSFAQAYNLSTMSILYTTNLTPYFPSAYINYSISSAYVTTDRQHLYLTLKNDTNEFNDFNLHTGRYFIAHFDLNEVGGVYVPNYTSGFNINYTSTQSLYVSPSVYSMWVNDAGTKLILGGRKTFSGSDGAFFDLFNLTNPHDLSAYTYYNNNPSGIISLNTGCGTSFRAWNSLYISQDYSVQAVICYDRRQSQEDTYLYAINSTSLIIPNAQLSNPEGLTLVNSFTSNYLFIQGGGTLYKYSVNFSASSAESINQTSGQVAVTQTITNIISIFPDSATLSFKQKMGYVFISMLLTALILMFASSQLPNGISKLTMWIVLIILFAEFIFFIAIGYINIAVLIILALIAITISYLFFRGNGGG